MSGPAVAATFYLAHALSDQGCLRQYLHCFGHVGFSDCPVCKGLEETAELVLFVFQRFRAIRDKTTCSEYATPDNPVQSICEGELGCFIGYRLELLRGLVHVRIKR